MITPFFSLDQDDEYVFVDVKVTHLRFNAQQLEMAVDNEVFIFSLNPYYLRLRFPHACEDDERSHAEYDSKSECVKIKLPKAQKGQHFEDLDLTAKLLARSNEKEKAGPLIQELDEPAGENIEPTEQMDQTDQKAEAADSGDFSWELPQNAPESLDGSARYGFNDQYSAVIGVSLAKGNDINELGDPESTQPNDRVLERLIKENIKFDMDYYAADYVLEKYPSPDDDKLFATLLKWKNPVSMLFLQWYKNKDGSSELMPVEFTKEEQERMLELPRKSYLVGSNSVAPLMMAVVSLLFSYHFDLRETEGDHNIESAWTVGKLTPQICFLDSLVTLSDDSPLRAAVVTGSRRALSYPLHRNYKLVRKVWDDVYYNLRGGKRLVLKSLLDLRELFRFHDIYYVYDKIWLLDLCAWIISDVLESSIRQLAHDLKKEYTSVEKTDITFEKVEGEDLVAINLAEIEEMVEESYQAYQNS